MARGKPPVATKATPAAAPVGKEPYSEYIEYSLELVDRICDRVAQGEALKKIFSCPGMPSRKTFYEWRAQHPEAKTAYLAAKEVQAEAHVEELIEIADEPIRSSEDVQDKKVRIATRQWIAEKHMNSVYGQRVAVGGSKDMPPVQHQVDGHLDVDLALSPADAYKRILGG